MNLTWLKNANTRKVWLEAKLSDTARLLKLAINRKYKQRLKVRYNEMMSEYLELERMGA